MRVVLFDLDGTLVSCGGAGRRALERALADRCGPLDGRLAPLRLDGMTDRLIVREALGILAHPFSEETRDQILARYLLHLALEVAGPGYAVLPGAVEALERLRAAGVAYGLCTGNLVEGARLKLARGGLDRHFEWNAGAVGGFGADGEARERLVIAAVRRAAARLGDGLAPSEVLVVGDTPRDIAAAHAAGCPALGVATGRFTAAELAACGADHVAGSLAEPAAVRLLGGP